MAKAKPTTEFLLTRHAKEEMARRQISVQDVAKVFAAPEQIETVRQGRSVYQSRIEMGKPTKMYLLRIFVDTDRQPQEVVTVYRTSKIQKYWRSNK
jgi:hypothetical protein